MLASADGDDALSRGGFLQGRAAVPGLSSNRTRARADPDTRRSGTAVVRRHEDGEEATRGRPQLVPAGWRDTRSKALGAVRAGSRPRAASSVAVRACAAIQAARVHKIAPRGRTAPCGGTRYLAHTRPRGAWRSLKNKIKYGAYERATTAAVLATRGALPANASRALDSGHFPPHPRARCS